MLQQTQDPHVEKVLNLCRNKVCTMCGLNKDIEDFHSTGKNGRGLCGKVSQCKQCKKEIRRAYYLINREKEIASTLKYQSDNKEWYDEYNNSDEAKQNRRRYEQSDKGKEVSRLKSQKRRAKEKSTEDGTITIEATKELLDSQGGVCNICGLDITERTLRHLDHIYPIAKGGAHSIDNVQWLCVSCNLYKSDKILIDNKLYTDE